MGQVLSCPWPGPAGVSPVVPEPPEATLLAKPLFLSPGSSGKNTEGLKDTDPEHKQRSRTTGLQSEGKTLRDVGKDRSAARRALGLNAGSHNPVYGPGPGRWPPSLSFFI